MADLKVVQAPWYIDCKNYNERTLSQFHYSEDDAAYRPQLTERSFIAKATSKFRQIQNYHRGQSEQCRLIYVNLASNDNRIKLYFDERFEAVDTFEQARIIVVPGCIDIDAPSEYTLAFEHFISDLTHYLPRGE
jgi:hypothetical protein